jgi:hypothetical protein
MRLLYLLGLGKRKREIDDDIQPSLSIQLRKEAEVETFVGGSLALISSNIAVAEAMPVMLPYEPPSKGPFGTLRIPVFVPVSEY